MSYREALAWLYGTQRFGIKLGLESARRLFAALNVSAPDARIIHVAGTNGKGSVCAFTDSILRHAGRRTGLFTSPHLVTFRERIRVDGVMISEADVAAGLAAIRSIVSAWDAHPTFFEITTALALRHFQQHECEVIVLETGLGGRLDATNAVPSDVAVITSVGLDHQKWLGETLAQIASEKAGIIKSDAPVISALQSPEAETVIRARAAECRAPLQIVSAPYVATCVALRGSHQRQNAALAIAAARAVGIVINDETIASAVAAVEWPARFQQWDDRIIIDGAHNPAAAGVLAATWRECFGQERATLILAILADKEIPGIVAELQPIAARVLLPAIKSSRAAAPEAVAAAFDHSDVEAAVYPSFTDALERAKLAPERILITGSLHFAGEALASLRGEAPAFEECSQ